MRPQKLLFHLMLVLFYTALTISYVYYLRYDRGQVS
jgi:hypothetical protein